jgi:hypothetical protein
MTVVRVERERAGERAEGEVVASGEPGKVHERLAGARAWLALGERLLDAGNAAEALAAARAGLEELGSDYASPRTKDDTSLKLALAEDRLAEGDTESAAVISLRMLEDRTELYADKHAGAIER